MNYPNLFIIGAPKCGTTSMIHYISKHPEVFVSPVKEPHYYNTDSKRRYYFEKNNYLKLFSESTNEHKYKCEGSVWYLYSHVAVSNILDDCSDAKFIVLLRDPKKMFFSLHQELLFGGSENETSAVKAWELQEIRKTGKKIPLGCLDPRMLDYGEACKLGKQVEHALKFIPENNVKFILLDEIISNPSLVYKEVIEFLKIKPFELTDYEVINKKKTRKWPLVARFFIHLTRIKKILKLNKGFGLASAINKLNVSNNKSLKDTGEKKLIPELEIYFKEDIDLLEKLINKDLSIWKKVQTK